MAKTPKEEMDATVEEEVKETPQDQVGEAEVPEAFQMEASELIGSIHNRIQLDYIRSLCSRKDQEIYEAEQKKKDQSKGKKKESKTSVPQEFSTAELPD